MGARRAPALCIALIPACWASSAVGKSGTDICRAIANDARRLECFDKLYPPLLPDSPASAPLATAATATVAGESVQPSKPRDAAHEFGLSAAQLQLQTAGKDQPRLITSISASVTDLQHGPNDRFVVVLDNGQVWRQIEVDSLAWPRMGETVTIRRGVLDSYMLITADRAASHVRRVK